MLKFDDFNKTVFEKLITFEADLIKKIRTEGWDGEENLEVQQWTFTGALFYSIIVITTIGKYACT